MALRVISNEFNRLRSSSRNVGANFLSEMYEKYTCEAKEENINFSGPKILRQNVTSFRVIKRLTLYALL